MNIRSLTILVLTLVLNSASAQKISKKRLILDLNADKGVEASEGQWVERWKNQVPFAASEFSKRDEGRKIPGSGRPELLRQVPELNGHNAISFKQQELLNMDEDAFDHLITGSGYTWFCVLRPGKQPGELKDVNCFFGNLRNKPNNEGFWGGFADDNSFWMSSRNAVTFGRWDNNNPYVSSGQILSKDRYYLIMGRMGKGTDTVMLSLYLNDGSVPVASHPFPVNVNANASKMAIGQERDAIEHPGRESFVGHMARFLIYDRPLADKEMKKQASTLITYYNITR